jgi:hypothetical protein
MTFYAIVFTEGQKLNLELQIEFLSLEKYIGCEGESSTDTQASLELIVNSVPKNKVLSRETKVDKNNQFGSFVWKINFISFSGTSAANRPKEKGFTYPAKFLDIKVWTNIRENIIE